MTESTYYLDAVVRVGDDIFPLGEMTDGTVLVRQSRLRSFIEVTGKAHPHDVVGICQLDEIPLWIMEKMEKVPME